MVIKETLSKNLESVFLILSYLGLAIFFLLVYTWLQPSLPSKFFTFYYNPWKGERMIADLGEVMKVGYFGLAVFLTNILLSLSIENKRIKKIIAFFSFLIALTLIFFEINLYFIQF